jgi:TetR/AcrR family transcriptional repressor of nem operon
MRYAAKHKEESRNRILKAAAKQFRAYGPETVRVSDVMKAAGLTHGGFYKHFSDKNQLLHEAIATALVQVSEQIAELTRGKSRVAALRQVIDFYLSEDHMRNPDLGCALAAMGTEIARMPTAIKHEISKALDAYTDRLSYLMPGKNKEEQRTAFLILFPSMAGCIMTARSLTNKAEQKKLLAMGRAYFTHSFCGKTPLRSGESLNESN